MGMDVLALIIFVLTIFIAFFCKVNIGVLALAVGAITVRLFGISDKELVLGINISLFLTLVGITLLFSIINHTGALPLLSKKIVSLAGKRIWLLPILLMLTGFLVVALGPGGIPALAILPPLATAVAMQTGYNPLMLSLIAICGSTAGRYSPITPESVIITSAIAETGYTGQVTLPIIVNTFLCQAITALVFFFLFKGHKVKVPEESIKMETEQFSKKQWLSLAGIGVMLFLIIVWKIDIGLSALLVSAVLLILKVEEDSRAIQSMPWGTILMVMGVGALLHIVDRVGAIQLINDGLGKITNQYTATPIMGLSSGLLSLVSSAMGVVYPTLMPLCVPLAGDVGVNAAALMSAVASGGITSGISPMSTGGALIIAAIATAKGEKFTKEDQSKTFITLIAMALLSLVILVVCCALFYVPLAGLLNPKG